MTTVAKFDGDLRVAGDLQVDGAIPRVPRSSLMQDPLAIFAVAMMHMRRWDSLLNVLPAAGADDDLGLYGGTFGSATPKLSTGDVKAAGCTRYARFQWAIPAEYEAAETITLRLNAGMETTVAGTSAEVDVECYKANRSAGVGSDICNTAAQSINSLVFANKDFVITPIGLTAGDILDVRLTITVVDAATGTAVIGSIGAVEMLVDIKG